MVAEQLSYKAGIARLCAACARAAELEVRLLELAADNGVVLNFLLLADLGDHVIEHGLLVSLALEADHLKGLGGADADADTAAHAVHGGDGHGVLVNALALAGTEVDYLSIGGSGCCLFLGQSEGTDGSMRADESTLVALCAGLCRPLGNECGHATLFICGSAELKGAVGVVDECGNGQGVAVHLVNGIEDGLDHLHGLFTALKLLGLGVVNCVGPLGGNIDLHESGRTCVNCGMVHVNDILTLLEVGGSGLFLHVTDRIVLRNDLCQREERRLQNGVRTLAHAYLLGKVDSVYHVKLDVVLCDVALGGSVKMLGKLLKAPLAVYKEHAAGLDITDDGEVLCDVCRNMACNEVCLVYVVRALDGLVAEAQVRDGNAAGLFRVVLEVCLNILVGMVADDLDGVLVCTDGTVAAETPELALNGTFRCGGGSFDLFKGQTGDIIDYADGELTLHIVLLKLVVDSKYACGRRILRAETVAAADDLDVLAGICNCGDNIEVQRLALCAGLLGAVENGYLLDCLGQSCKQLVCSPGTVQSYLDKTDLLALGGEVIYNFLCNIADRAHSNDNTVSIGSAVVVEQLIVRTELFVYLAHVLLDYLGDGFVILVGSLTVLEEDISVLVRAAHGGMLGVKCSVTEGLDGVHVAHFLKIFVIPNGDLLDLVRGTEAVEEVYKRNSALDSGKMSNGSKVHDLLNIALAEHCKAGLAAGHDIRMVAEDAERMACDGTGGDMEHGGKKLACHLVHVGYHKEQTLGSGVGGGKSTCVQAAVDSACRTGLCLHLLHLNGAAEDVLLTLCRPLVNEICHGAGRGDGVYCRYFRKRIAYMCSCLVAVHCFEFSCHNFIST